jgi:prepilin-type N-terminal cleavage/methylation domain-containing protein
MSRNEPGFGLVELIVALTILSIGLLALTGAAAVAQRSFVHAHALEEGVEVAAMVLDSLMREPAPVAGEHRQGRTRAQWSIETDSVVTLIRLEITVQEGSREQRLAFHASHHAR